MFSISNLKISLKISDICLKSLLSHFECLKIPFNIKSNYIIVRYDFVYIFYKSKDCKVRFINVTKIKCETYLDQVVKKLCDEILAGFELEILSKNTDNITAGIKLDKKIDLNKICLSSENPHVINVKYNKEKFPGVFLKFREGTLIIFYSGNVNVVGCKSVDHLETLHSHLIDLMSKCSVNT